MQLATFSHPQKPTHSAACISCSGILTTIMKEKDDRSQKSQWQILRVINVLAVDPG